MTRWADDTPTPTGRRVHMTRWADPTPTPTGRRVHVTCRPAPLVRHPAELDELAASGKALADGPQVGLVVALDQIETHDLWTTGSAGRDFHRA